MELNPGQIITIRGINGQITGTATVTKNGSLQIVPQGERTGIEAFGSKTIKLPPINQSMIILTLQ